jgi:transcriptional regulator with XRE-family HTH domain
MPNLTLAGQRLREARQRIGWSQERLAEAVGATSISIRRWERGQVLPHPHYRERLSQALGVPIEVLFDLSCTAEEPSKLVANLPYLRNRYFTGREELLC